MMRYHVIPTTDGAWGAKRPGAHRLSRRFPTLGEAYRWARKRTGWVVAHYPDGRVRRVTQTERRAA